jgi:hypothetical protein
MKFLETMANSFVCWLIGHDWGKTWKVHNPNGTTTQRYVCLRWPCEARKTETK